MFHSPERFDMTCDSLLKAVDANANNISNTMEATSFLKFLGLHI